MRKYLLQIFLTAFAVAICSGRCSAYQENGTEVLRYLPDENDLAGWSELGNPQTARGDDLYLLIDGGAEIFLEYGFEETVLQSYVNGNEKSINLEIYKMEDSSGAYGMYTFRTSEGCKAVPIGDEACIEDYYMNFWKGSFIVTVIGFDTDEETVEGVKTIARAVAARIKESRKKPSLTGFLPEKGLRPNGIKYIRGNLALYNNYELSKSNIFGLSEGVIGVYGDHNIFLFVYIDETESRKWFLNGVDSLKSNPDYHDLEKHENGCSMRDKGGSHLRIETCRNYIIFVLGTKENTESIMIRQRTRIDGRS